MGQRIVTGIVGESESALAGAAGAGAGLAGPKLVPVNGVINVGGELEVTSGLKPGQFTNLNDLSTPIKPSLVRADPSLPQIPNLVVGRGEQMGDLFAANSATRITAQRLPGSVDFDALASGAFKVLKPGGTIDINIYGQADSPYVAEALESFQKAGFDAKLAPNVAADQGLPGPATIVGSKPGQ
jgi:hypothetical protein